MSSHALGAGTGLRIHFHTAVFTNLTRDHLDFHHTMEEYAAAKRLLFVPADASGAGVGGAERGRSGERGDVRTGAAAVLWYGIVARSADSRAENIRSGFDGLRFDLCYQGARQPVESALVGRINVLNILAAAGAG